MDRRAWIDERRAAVMADYDAEAATYDQNPIRTRTARMGSPSVGDLSARRHGAGRTMRDGPLLPPGGRERPSSRGHRPIERHARPGPGSGIAIELQHVGLQELAFVARFDAVMTIDALENVAPEDWPLVLANLHRAMRPAAATST